jgi:UDP-3-O-[3-hydroxymyristoyl] N-acetylglucosamine deacetylase/3-hydroxyacyl-[acyl-carrier-protein] dehydratase
MAVKQCTIGKPVAVKGKGLHTGLETEITFTPAPENFGFKFKRVDLEGQPIVSAIAENVVDTSRGTTIEEKGVRISTIEHVMAALVGSGVDNAIMEITGPETPIVDGSSDAFVKAIKEAGIVEQDAERKYYEIKEKITYSDPVKGIDITIYPDDHLSYQVMVDYNSKVLANQFAVLNSLENFNQEISMCRTFVFLHELEFLLQHNLIKGGDLNNALVIIDRPVTQEELDRLADLFQKPKVQVKAGGVLNNLEPHFTNEPARHKLLDLVGDLSLIGMPIKGRVIASRPGHAANNEIARLVRKKMKRDLGKPTPPDYDPNSHPLFDVVEIQKRIPHRFPFLLVDKITHLDEWVVTGVKCVTMNEAFFVGHFPDEPIMPGVLQIEAMAQVGAILLLSGIPDPQNYLVYFMKIENVKFKQKVTPGDVLNMRLILTEPIKRGIALCTGQGFVGDKLVIEAEFMAQMSRKPNL